MKITTTLRWHFLLLFIIILSLLVYPAAGCKTSAPELPQPVPSIPQDPTIQTIPMPGLVPFINERREYIVYYPKGWFIENNLESDERGILDFHAPAPHHAWLSIVVYDIEKMEIETDIELVAQRLIDDTENIWGEIVLTDNVRLNDNWNWYFEFDGVLWDLDFRVMTYVKQTDNFLYTLKLQLVEEEFDEAYLSNLEQIPELFELHPG